MKSISMNGEIQITGVVYTLVRKTLEPMFQREIREMVGQ